VDRVQRHHGVDVPIIMNPVAAGLVEAWAKGCAWERLISATNIGEGDIVRQMRRTADILRQFSRIPEIPDRMGLLAKEALRLIYREPIKEIELPEEETENAAPAEPAKASDVVAPLLAESEESA
jgi:superfamily II RNA helicase